MLDLQKAYVGFRRRHGSTQCLRLLGVDISTPEGLQEVRQNALFHERCTGLVRDAVEIVEAMLPEVKGRRQLTYVRHVKHRNPAKA